MKKINPKNFDKKIVSECPILYKNRYSDMSRTAMCWGFEIDKGWHNLVYELSKKIEKINQILPEEQRCIAVQVKSKYGGLRFYTNGGSEEIEKLISEAENRSYKICEYCGKRGKLVTLNGWDYTICSSCKKKEEKRLNKIYKKEKK